MQVFNSRSDVIQFLTKDAGMISDRDGQWFAVPGFEREDCYSDEPFPIFQPREYRDGWGIYAHYHVPQNSRCSIEIDGDSLNVHDMKEINWQGNFDPSL